MESEEQCAGISRKGNIFPLGLQRINSLSDTMKKETITHGSYSPMSIEQDRTIPSELLQRGCYIGYPPLPAGNRYSV